jgi:hypothetical protein
MAKHYVNVAGWKQEIDTSYDLDEFDSILIRVTYPDRTITDFDDAVIDEENTNICYRITAYGDYDQTGLYYIQVVGLTNVTTDPETGEITDADVYFPGEKDTFFINE